MKEILIINGSGGVGKGTFVKCLGEFAKVRYVSIIDKVKEIAKAIGWDGDKSEINRKFLSDLKILIDNYNDFNYIEIQNLMKRFKAGEIDAEILCVDMREKNQIERAKKEYNAKVLLVKRDSVPQITSNIADAGVYEIDYDFIVKNNGTLDDLKKWASIYVETLRNPELIKVDYKKVVYISHPYQGKRRNFKSIDRIMKRLVACYPSSLFISPVHAFGAVYNMLDYNDGLRQCFWLLQQSDEMWVFGNYQQSRGCKNEIRFCEKNNIPYKLIGTNFKEVL